MIRVDLELVNNRGRTHIVLIYLFAIFEVFKTCWRRVVGALDLLSVLSACCRLLVGPVNRVSAWMGGSGEVNFKFKVRVGKIWSSGRR